MFCPAASRGNFNFGNADQTVNFAINNGRIVRGHTLGKPAEYSYALFEKLYLLGCPQSGTPSSLVGSTASTTGPP